MREFIGVGAVVGWFLYLTRRALQFGFNPDDEMNLYFGLRVPFRQTFLGIPFFWNGYVRPLGNMFYLVLYNSFGYWAAPFRIAAFALIVLNLLLLFRLVKTLTRNRTAALLAILLACFHPEMWDIFASTGTIYDVLCQTFILLALLLWTRPKQPSSGLLLSAIAVLTIAAIDSKEVGVALPVILLAHDAIFRPKSLRYAGIAASGTIVAIFLAGRFMQPTTVTGIAAYTPVVSIAQFVSTTQGYLNLLLFKPGLSQSGAVFILLGTLALALLLRNRVMIFGWALYLFALLPMSFVPQRAGYALYIPLTGAVLFTVAFAMFLLNRLPSSPKLLRHAALALVTLGVMAAQLAGSRRLEAEHTAPSYQRELEALSNGMRRNFPNLPKHAKVTLINDPFGDDAVPLFTLIDLYGDPSLTLQRVRWDPAKGTGQLPENTSPLFFSGLRCWAFGSRDAAGGIVDGQPRESVAMSSPFADWNIVAGVAGEALPDGRRWAFADPEFVFTRPAHASQLRFDYEVPSAVMDQTGPLRLSFEVDGRHPQPETIPLPGTRSFLAPVPATGNPLVHLKIHVENPYRGSDGVHLSMLVSRAGLE